MGLQLDARKYPIRFFYFMLLYFMVLIWSLSLSYGAYSFLEAQLLLLLMVLPAILLAVYIFHPTSHMRAFRAVISFFAVISIIVSVLMGYIFLF